MFNACSLLVYLLSIVIYLIIYDHSIYFNEIKYNNTNNNGNVYLQKNSIAPKKKDMFGQGRTIKRLTVLHINLSFVSQCNQLRKCVPTYLQYEL